MQHRARKQLVSGLDVALDELLVFGTAAPAVAIAEIERVLQQLFVVGADVKRHREAATGIDTAACGVERQLTHGDLDAAHTPVADTQDRFGVGAHNQVDVIGPEPERLKRFGDHVGFVDAQEQSPLSPVLVGEALDGLPDGGRVHHRHQFGQMVGQHLEVQEFVTVVQLLQQQVAAQIGGHGLQLAPDTVGLLFEREHRRRQPAGQPQPSSLFMSEADPSIESR